MSTIVQKFEHSLALPFFGTGMKTDLFQSCGHCWVFQICWHNECSTLTASSFRIWNSLAGILSPLLAFFVLLRPIWLHTPRCLAQFVNTQYTCGKDKEYTKEDEEWYWLCASAMSLLSESISQYSLSLENMDCVQIHWEVQQIIYLPKWETLETMKKTSKTFLGKFPCNVSIIARKFNELYRQWELRSLLILVSFLVAKSKVKYSKETQNKGIKF